MIAELAQIALLLALGLALIQGVLPLVGAQTGRPRWIAIARPAALGQGALITLAFGLLVALFVLNDFSVAYVAGNSNSRLPVYYRISASWGGHEGSMLLWIQILAGWTVAVALFSRSLQQEDAARVLAVLGLISSGFLAFLLFASNPFARGLPGPLDGRDLNPLLQDIGMIAHPPLLYMGYVGFSVAFAFAVAALISGRLDSAWARWSRPWTLVAWAFLTLGILLGSFWAYYELGWGGWWFWDAVENASFMPWLVGTALIHSLAVSEKRGSFKNWTVLLAILAFSLSLLGTFLVRSGVLTSVHAFATDPRRGLFILALLALVIGGALSLYAWRAPQIGLGGRFALFSRETLLLLNNLLLLVAAGTILLGTLYPLLLDALNLGKISVGPPYFEAVFVPLMLPLLALLAVGPYVAWQRGNAAQVWQRLRWPLAASLLLGASIALARLATPMLVLGLTLAAWIIQTTVAHVWQRLARGEGGLWAGLRGQPLSYWGMLLAHAGVAVFLVGVTLVKGLESSRDVSLKVGEQATLAGYTFAFADLSEVRGPNYLAARARFAVSHAGEPVASLYPEKRFYLVQRSPMTEAAIDRSLGRDLYVSLGDGTPQGAWQVRVQHKPFMAWVWLGALLIALGGFIAVADRRYRLARSKAAHQPTTASATPALALEG